MTIARSETVAEGLEGTYHCMSRCVRRAFLCGEDRAAGRDYGHRKAWIRNRLRGLAAAFGMDIFAYAVMSNHLHVVLRNRPDLARAWPDAEAAARWLRVFPRRWTRDGQPEEPTAEEIRTVVRDPKIMAPVRARLSSVSWFMKALNEYVARRANREDGCKGHFWESRFKCQRLADDAALLACMAYADLNPVRAKAAETVEASDFTSGQDRARAEKARRRVATYRRSKKEGAAPKPRREALLDAERGRAGADAWLAGFRPGELRMKADEYLGLLDWTGRELRAGKRGAVPDGLAGILTRLDVDAGRWVSTVERYDSLFWRVAGRAEALVAAARAAGVRWLKGVAACREAFGSGGAGAAGAPASAPAPSG